LLKDSTTEAKLPEIQLIGKGPLDSGLNLKQIEINRNGNLVLVSKETAKNSIKALTYKVGSGYHYADL
jgi:hypothetical protein